MIQKNEQSWFAARSARLSTAGKMFFILLFGLLPLGVVAILASIQSAADNRSERREEISTRVQLKAQRIDSALSRSSLTLRAASDAVAARPVTAHRHTRHERVTRNSARTASGQSQ